KKPLSSFTDVPNGIVFIIHDGRLIDVPDGQLQYRQWMRHGRTQNELGQDACSEQVVDVGGDWQFCYRLGADL
ncbi:MAG TPA: hypothetical protein PKC28_06315, partial [Bdellovibrionales bacterium]|nr:hypothetical protein [Bdellovibrionales bacterium]